jgi:multidrug efflux pump subunit AcrB
MERIVAWFTNNHVAANLLMLFLLVAGVLAVQTIKIETFPEFTLDMISISMEYPGASPSEVEEAVVRRIEEAVAGLAGIKKIDSSARESFGTVTIEVLAGWDKDNLLNDIKSEVDRIRTFPKEAEKPVVRLLTRKNQVINLALYGDVPEATIKYLAEKIKDDLTNMPGITLVELFGVRRGEIHIDISEKTLSQYRLTLNQVASLIQRASMDLPAGNIKSEDGTILIRTKGRRYRAADYADIAILTSPDGTKVTLGQIATLTDGYEDNDLELMTRGKPAAFIQIYRVADQSALKVAKTVKDYVADIRDDLPEGMDITFFSDRSIILNSRINLLLKNMALGLILVIGLLSLFLNIRLAFWVTLGIPIAFATGLWLPFDSAILGTQQVAKPVIFAVLTTIAAFWPLLMIPGTRGNIMRNIPVVVIVILIGSLVEALFILPAHLSRCKFKFPREDPEKPQGRRMDLWLKNVIRGPYKRFLEKCLEWRYVTVAIGVTLLIITLGYVLSGRVKFTIFPRMDADNLICSVVMPASTPVSRTREVLEHIERSAIEVMEEQDAKRPEGAPSILEDYFSLIGVHMGGHGPRATTTSGGNLAQVHVQLLEGEKRDIKASYLANQWRKKVGPIIDAETVTFKGQLRMADAPVEVQLSSNDQVKLLEAVEAMKEKYRSYPGLKDINDSYMPGKDELQLKLRPAARSLGLTLNDLAQQVRGAFYGAEALRFQYGQDEVKVLVRYPNDERRSLGSVDKMRIRLADGTEVPFNQVADVTYEQGYSTITRSRRQRVISVTADIEEGQANTTEVNRALETEILPRMRELHPEVRVALEGEALEDREFMTGVLRSFVIALFLIYALLAIPFKSFAQPFIVMAAIPFGLVGAIIGHIVMGYDITMVSLFGIVGLSGVVVNDSLILIEATNRIKEGGRTHLEAITAAGQLRFRAIILTSITTFGGLTPMIFERSIQARFLIPMAAGLGFGILFATGITLLLIPCLYLILEDIHLVFKRLASGLGRS